ncbi:helix-turn-helix domain-containing protein [Nonomuraea sp. NPDC003754]
MSEEGGKSIVIPATLWENPDMISALTNRDMGHMLRLVRQYAGVSQTRIGVAVGLSQGKVSEIMKGAVRVTSFKVFERIAEGLYMPDLARMLLGLAPQITSVLLPCTHILARDGSPASPSTSVEQVGPHALGSHHPNDFHELDVLKLSWVAGRQDTQMDRRTILLLAAGITADVAASITDPWERLARALSGPQALDEDTIAHLETRTIGFHHLEYLLPARTIYQGLTAHLTELSNVLQSGPPERFRRRLAATAGEAATLAAWIAWDLKRPAQCASFNRVSALAAAESGHPVIQACTYAYKSYALEGVPALQAVRQAQAFLPAHGDDSTRAWLLNREAEELAALGDRRAFELLRQAEEAFDHSRPHQERVWTGFLDVGRMAAFRLSTYVRLGDERHALDAGQTALDSIGQKADQKRAAIIYADVARAQFQLGDVAEGVNYARRALEATQRIESRWGFQHLFAVETILANQHNEASRELLGDLIAARRKLRPTP